MLVRSQSRLQFGLSIRVVPNSYLWLLLVIPHGSIPNALQVVACPRWARSTRFLSKLHHVRFVVRPCYSTTPSTWHNSLTHSPQFSHNSINCGYMVGVPRHPIGTAFVRCQFFTAFQTGILVIWLLYLRLATRSKYGPAQLPAAAILPAPCFHCPLSAVYPARCLPI
jgi:hypothetical protein